MVIERVIVGEGRDGSEYGGTLEAGKMYGSEKRRGATRHFMKLHLGL